ncbi:DUF6074 family protein [Mesorhizobium prunaredense]|uniref:DUF6074 family protein n=1 Tax=Mesorhizobium prunaredense TaxID=1631249 RepID=UPI003CC7D138
MTAQLIPFPAAFRTGRIRHVASILRRKHGLDADRYWRQQLMVMQRQMILAGIDADMIDHELRAFTEAVFGSVPVGHGGQRA